MSEQGIEKFKKMILARLDVLSHLLEDTKIGEIKVLDNAICWEIKTRKMILEAK